MLAFVSNEHSTLLEQTMQNVLRESAMIRIYKTFLPLLFFLLAIAPPSASEADDSQLLVDENFVLNSTLATYRDLAAESVKTQPSGKDQRTAVHYAIRFGTPEHLRTLVELGYDINRPNKFLNTPLHWAAAAWDTQQSGSSVDFVKILVSAGVDLNPLTIYGETPIMFADSIETAKTLLEAGADAKIEDQNGRDAVEYQQAAQRPQVASFISKFESSRTDGQPDSASGSGWIKDSGLNEMLSALDTLPQTSIPDACSVAHGPIPEETRNQLLANTVLTAVRNDRTFEARSRDLIRDYGSVCLGSLEECSSGRQAAYYCTSGEALFVWYGGKNKRYMAAPYIVTSVRRDEMPLDMDNLVYKPVHDANLRTIPTQIAECSILNAWDDGITSVRWSGACKDNHPVGDGTIEWMRGEEVYWRTQVGQQWGIVLEAGQLFVSVDLGKFSFNLVTCDRGAGYRRVDVIAPSNLAEEYFANGWVTSEIETAIANFAVDQCPVQRKGLSNIAFRIGLNGVEVVRGRSDQVDNIRWSEYRNPARDRLSRELEEQEQDRERIKRQEEEALARAAAEAEKQALADKVLSMKREVDTEWREHMLGVIADTSSPIGNIADVAHFNTPKFISMFSSGRLIYFIPRSISMNNGVVIVSSEVSTTPIYAEISELLRGKKSGWDQVFYDMQNELQPQTYRINCLVQPADSEAFGQQTQIAVFATLREISGRTIVLDCDP